MKKIISITFLLTAFISIFSACKNDRNQVVSQSKKVVYTNFDTILTKTGVEGSILIYDLQEDCYYSNDFAWAHIARLPASTFKICNSIIALETGVMENDSILIKWDGKERTFDVWERDMTFSEAFKLSCVNCYQEIARKIGPDRMNAKLELLEYGSMQVDSSNIDVFWLEGESGISQMQQIDFLKRLYNNELKISQRTDSIIRKMMILEENEEYILRAKTGWAIRNGHNNGWFVGYLDKQGAIYFFATNINPGRDFNMKLFYMIRKDLTMKAFEELDLL